MTTYTADNAKAGKAASGHGFGGTKKTAFGVYHITSEDPVANDVIQLCRVPKGAVVIGGEFWGSKLEFTTSGAALDMDIGYAANGVDVADTDAFGNFGVLSYAAVTGYKPEATGFKYPLGNVLLTAGYKELGAETVISATVNATATSIVSGFLAVTVDYILP